MSGIVILALDLGARMGHFPFTGGAPNAPPAGFRVLKSLPQGTISALLGESFRSRREAEKKALIWMPGGARTRLPPARRSFFPGHLRCLRASRRVLGSERSFAASF
jgi:hypothetical protein